MQRVACANTQFTFSKLANSTGPNCVLLNDFGHPKVLENRIEYVLLRGVNFNYAKSHNLDSASQLLHCALFNAFSRKTLLFIVFLSNVAFYRKI